MRNLEFINFQISDGRTFFMLTIKYIFADGTTNEIEVTDELYALHRQLVQEEKRNLYSGIVDPRLRVSLVSFPCYAPRRSAPPSSGYAIRSNENRAEERVQIGPRDDFRLTNFTERTYHNGMALRQYDRQAAVAYAKKWAYARNPAFYNFDRLGGDCTNFASQCIYAGAGVMNLTPVVGWFYKNANDRTASWTGVEYLYKFLTGNGGAGPFAEETEKKDLEIGDVVQLGRANGDFYHSPVVTGFFRGQPLVSAHTYDTYNKPLSSYLFERARYLHILGVRTE